MPTSVLNTRVTPALAQILGHLALLLQSTIQLAEQDAQHLQSWVEVQDLLDALLEHLQALQRKEARLGRNDHLARRDERVDGQQPSAGGVSIMTKS